MRSRCRTYSAAGSRTMLPGRSSAPRWSASTEWNPSRRRQRSCPRGRDVRTQTIILLQRTERALGRTAKLTYLYSVRLSFVHRRMLFSLATLPSISIICCVATWRFCHGAVRMYWAVLTILGPVSLRSVFCSRKILGEPIERRVTYKRLRTLRHSRSA